MSKSPFTVAENPGGFFASVVDASLDCIRILTPDGCVEFMNARGQELLEIEDFDQNRGRPWPDLWPPAAHEAVAAALEAALCGEMVSFIAQCPTARGAERWWTTTVTPVRGEGGEIVRLLATSRDITEWRASRAALHDALERAEAANLAKSEFLANMSHEIRTPFNAVLGMIQVMQGDAPSELHRERLDLVQRSGEALLGIFDDILDLSRIETGMLHMRPADFSLDQLVRDAAAAFEPAAIQRGLELRLTVDSSAADMFRGDPVRIRQIIHNLLSNAVKFTEHGWVELRIVVDGSETRISVTDTGPGIEADRMAVIFDRFVQGDGSSTRRHGGSGLGLAVARELAELMGGWLKVESVCGRGSVFTFGAPLERQGPSDLARPEAPAAHSDERQEEQLRVLVAEDNPTNQLVLRSLLLQVGIDPEIVENGAEAVAAWETGTWDLVLMDIQMPEMDGCTATQRIREREARTGRPRVPIIAVTANTLDHQVAVYRELGMDDVVAKPVQVALLYAALERTLAAADQHPQARPRPARRHSR